jgi:hypothetical protein
MTPVDILHLIVSTEQLSRSLYADAKEKEAHFAELLEIETQRLREDTFKSADAELSELDRTETKQSGKTIAELDARLRADLEKARLSFDAHKAEYIDKIFGIVVNADA